MSNVYNIELHLWITLEADSEEEAQEFGKRIFYDTQGMYGVTSADYDLRIDLEDEEY